MGYDHSTWGVGEWLAMGGLMLLFWASVISLAVWAVRRGSRPRDEQDRLS